MASLPSTRARRKQAMAPASEPAREYIVPSNGPKITPPAMSSGAFGTTETTMATTLMRMNASGASQPVLWRKLSIQAGSSHSAGISSQATKASATSRRTRDVAFSQGRTFPPVIPIAWYSPCRRRVTTCGGHSNDCNRGNCECKVGGRIQNLMFQR